MTSSIDDLLKLCVERCGTEAAEGALRALLDGPDVAERTSTLTIIANVGVHEIPEKLRRGEVYSASQGNWQVSSDEDLSREVRRILVGVAGRVPHTYRPPCCIDANQSAGVSSSAFEYGRRSILERRVLHLAP